MRVSKWFFLPLALSAVGCVGRDKAESSPSATPQAAAPTAQPQPTAAEAPPKPAGTDLEKSTEAQPPFVLTLKGPDKVPDAGDFEVIAKIDARVALSTPATLVVTLPGGAKLVSGKDREALPSIAAGETLRTFKFSVTKMDGPIKIALDMRDPAGARGAHAERIFPETSPSMGITGAPAKTTRAVPPPPVSRPGAPAR
ncbi:MAG: hypothetical protein IT374_24420 [Polyangiaceae bacterium]|nr:hypothetical protein [Polyangiaceae bacterium]